MNRLLLVEDDTALSRTLHIGLQARGYDVRSTTLGAEAMPLAQEFRPDIAIVDLGLPDVDGIEVVRALRAWSDLPVLVLSARTTQDDKVAALDGGADDYVTKPFGMDELLARLRAALRRVPPAQPSSTIRTEELTIDRAARRVDRNGAPVHLTPTEWNVLDVLLRAPRHLVTQRELLHEVWGPQYAHETNYLRVYIAQLRRKLEARPSAPRHILTEPGAGYRFEP
ncbi:response regulator [Cellulomonas shaoxiangyii]|uniref:Response regulator n=1 Tax=Cellulomonas shaoxiangyii TaxID=2566013 RepID=A0A4P7SFD5_9CELL|nr:response regulator [Cellulomonas shaoxiangyii]QCB92702.1 response regulator [Cellulomonas shaoxiangyii]TGY85827.1 response regulator [Cellulomonas shaoxiangyii]